jgi:hypothetical protein
MTTGTRWAALFLFALAFAAGPEVRAQGSSAAAAPDLPREADGVLLDDGRQIEGTYEEIAGQKWVIQPKAGGEPLTVWVTQIVVAEKAGSVEQRGEEGDAAKVWRAAIRARYLGAMEAILLDCAKASLVERARGVLQAMKSAGADAARLAKLEASLPAKSGAGNAEADKDAAAKQAAAVAARIGDLQKAVAWCTKRGFPTAATSMLTEIANLDPSRKDAVAAATKELVPSGFAFKDASDAVTQWARWADLLLPSSAQFVDKSDEDVWNNLENEPWTDGKTLCFRTSNVLLYIRDTDPAVCGRVLRLAESTVRALQVFLNDGEPDTVSNDLSRLQIRIHKNRADYLAEEPKRGRKAEVWSAGYFSPLDRTSHFYVERDKSGKADVQELTRVLTHEFTHHYITARWITRIITARGAHEMPGGPGFWIVEGLAEFVQNQSHHEGEPRFDDDTVLGNDITAGARRAGLTSKYLATEKFMDMTRTEFEQLSDGPLGMVKSKRFAGVLPRSERGLWYDQAGALTYFFLQKKGLEMRKKFVRYCSDHYAGNTHVPAWKYFGYGSAEELDADFVAFLKTIS